MRLRLIAAFTELSATKGFYRVTMDEVAAAAGISKRTLYRYFKGKEEIIEAVIDNFLGIVGNRVDEIITSDKTIEEKFTGICNLFYHVGRNMINPLVIQDLSQHYPQFWKKIDDYRMKKGRKIIKHLLGGINAVQGLNPKIVETVLLASLQAVLNPDFILAHGLTFEETVEQMVLFFKRAFGADDLINKECLAGPEFQ